MTERMVQDGGRFRPEKIEVDNREQVLDIQWADGHLSKYPLYALRRNCPCVVCRGGHDRMGELEMEWFFRETHKRIDILELREVGNHALSISWSDGHSSGMYRWELLRHLCPIEYRERMEEAGENPG
ncbi:MAG: DUF971 domain-containing protein [Balneolaceae bacterium]